jgi:superkiller protein 3
MHMDLGEHSKALSCFREALDQDASTSAVWLNLARARLKLWQYNEALQAIEEGLQRAESRNEFGQLYQVRGETLVAMLRPNEALTAFDQGLSYTPNAPALWRERGALYLKNGRLREAEQCLTKALEYDQLDPEAWRLLGDIHIAQNQPKHAHRALGEALKLDPRSSIGWARYGVSQLKLDRVKEAIRSFDAALKLDPELQEAKEGMRAAKQRLK